MHRYTETRVLPYTPAQLFGLVVDIEKYPQFLPWCRGARVVSREGDGAFLGELVISFSHLTERYTSRIMAVAPTHQPPTPSPQPLASEGRIDVALVSGPFHYLNNHWRFVPHADGCEIHLDLDFEFKSKLLDKMLGGFFGRACDKMVGAFTTRAEALYGKQAL
jgi:coenzyme Q-binding protein COQ10